MSCTAPCEAIYHIVSKKRIQEGVDLSMRSFTVQRRDEYRIIKENDHFIQLNGSTLVRIADVIGPVTTVGKYSHPRTGSKNLDFPLINERGRTLRVTLWGKLGVQLLKMMSGHCGNYTIILTSMSAK
ncbi:nucleic acid-binding, OB-fold protein [Artemisia annua]|uniref:Nucleic acid-binding, OB-fold protein n=1 Tax=Artemisia annua TaxID=35608 RepID=A0A2U1QP56_ARTAN|nr:nucleic acid-binding, OB-fold protein [Artemisia annua]